MQQDKNQTPHLTIVRGFPGSGKTSFGRELAMRKNALFIEPDMFLYDRDGKYHYLPGDFIWAVSSSIRILHNYFVKGGVFAIYADVLPRRDNVYSFVSQIQTSDFPVDLKFDVHDMPKISFAESMVRNVHNVCEEDLKRMFDEWEDWEKHTTWHEVDPLTREAPRMYKKLEELSKYFCREGNRSSSLVLADWNHNMAREILDILAAARGDEW